MQATVAHDTTSDLIMICTEKFTSSEMEVIMFYVTVATVNLLTCLLIKFWLLFYSSRHMHAWVSVVCIY